MAAHGAFIGQLGRYKLLRQIAVGGMGEIFLAKQLGAEGFERQCVVKTILPQWTADPDLRTMLVNEAQLVAHMSHPNIGQVYELGEVDGELFIAMEYLRGVTLLALLKARAPQPLPIGFVINVITQVCEGLHYAHELCDEHGRPYGIVHRDVSPSNILITDGGTAKLLDFGIAKNTKTDSATRPGAAKGKYAYMAPEQAQDAPVDRRADVFAVGVLLYEMLSGRPLFHRKNEFETLAALQAGKIPDLQVLRPEVPDTLASVVRRALSAAPAARYATARHLTSALSSTITGKVWTPQDIATFVAQPRTSQQDGAMRTDDIEGDVEPRFSEVHADFPVLQLAAEDAKQPSLHCSTVTSQSGALSVAAAELRAEPSWRRQKPRGAGALLLVTAMFAGLVGLAALVWVRVHKSDARSDLEMSRVPAHAKTRASLEPARSPPAMASGRIPTFAEALERNLAQLTGCGAEYLRASNTSVVELVVRVNDRGAVSNIDVLPPQNRFTPLGVCLRNVVNGLVFSPMPRALIWRRKFVLGR